MIDVAIAIDGEARKAMLHRNAPGRYVEGGRYVAGERVSREIRVVEQPLNARDLDDLREGVREEARVKFYSRTVLVNDDVIESGGRSYRVLHVWDRQIEGGHSRVAAGLLA